MQATAHRASEYGGATVIEPIEAPTPAPYLSVVIPVLDEAENLPILAERLVQALEALGRSYEVIVVDDGSRAQPAAARGAAAA
jgi:cellulose synthase/poly-beta-1,6-N-acetylglucosamine synthase-like glycosyltransferase